MGLLNALSLACFLVSGFVQNHERWHMNQPPCQTDLLALHVSGVGLTTKVPVEKDFLAA
jgi:hypothetical protein